MARRALRGMKLAGLALALGAAACGSKGGGGSVPTGPAAFIGTWTPIGQEAGLSVSSETCGTSAPEVDPITSPLTIVAGSNSDAVAFTTTSGCRLVFSVSQNMATADSGQTCTSGDGGSGAVESLSSYTLIADGANLITSFTGSLMKTSGATCSLSGVGEYVKK